MFDKIKSLVGKAAPLLGTLIGGPAAPAIAGLIASKLGVEPTESAIEAALKTDPEAATKLAEIESEERKHLQSLATQQAIQQMAEETTRIEAVNATMRAEAASEKWWVSGWRPFWGFASGLAFAVLAAFLCLLAYRAVNDGDANAMTMIPQLVTSFTAYFGIAGAILGIASWHRGQKQREQARIVQPT